MSERKTLPAATLPVEGYELLNRFAHSKKMSISEAVRYLCQTAPELIEFAQTEDLSGYFQVKPWGGYRERADESE